MSLAIPSKSIVIPQHPSNIITVVLVGAFHRCTEKMIWVAEKLGHPWLAFHVASEDPHEELTLFSKWRNHFPQKELIVAKSPASQLRQSLVEFVRIARDKNPSSIIHTLTGHFVSEGSFTPSSHLQQAMGIHTELAKIPRVFVTNVAYEAGDEEDL